VKRLPHSGTGEGADPLNVLHSVRTEHSPYAEQAETPVPATVLQNASTY